MRPAVMKGKQLIEEKSPLLKLELESGSNSQPFSRMRLPPALEVCLIARPQRPLIVIPDLLFFLISGISPSRAV
jgi:hypothetical protein